MKTFHTIIAAAFFSAPYCLAVAGPEPINACGTVINGVECPLFLTEDQRLFQIPGLTWDFVGGYIRVQGYSSWRQQRTRSRNIR